MLHEILPHIYDNRYADSVAAEEDYLLIFRENTLLLAEKEGELEIPAVKDFAAEFSDMRECVRFLFRMDGKGVYLARDGAVEEHDPWRYMNTMDYRYMMPRWKAFACSVGEQLRRWYGDNSFCGRCGGPLLKHGAERALCCMPCDRTVYPVISPSIIVAVTDSDRLLLTKYAHGPYKEYALIAGYSEVGESIEETVRREVLEEVGLRVGNIRYYKSQPWPFSDALLFGFFADLDGPAEVRLQEDELAEATWFERHEVPANATTVSLTAEMINAFKNGFTGAAE